MIPISSTVSSTVGVTCRLFFRAFKEVKIIVILWLGFPRKEGDKKDCYQVFYKKVASGDFPENLESLMAEIKVEESEEED
jgi:toxin YhaV